jgi:hypothetical protein
MSPKKEEKDDPMDESEKSHLQEKDKKKEKVAGIAPKLG